MSHPTNFQPDISWGALTLEPRVYIASRYFPMKYKVAFGGEKAPDVSVELLKKYLEPAQDVNVHESEDGLTIGKYTVPTFRDGSSFVFQHVERTESHLVARYDGERKAMKYYNAYTLYP
ncbi:MAG TPA: hypothetical protein DCP63_02465, partial [Bacteroidetes bacterium]|nr:hypothetical protein [Bacteroidota bacterium]